MSLKLALCAAILLLGFELPAQAHDNYSLLNNRSGNRCCKAALPETQVDLALVLAVGVSFSMEPEEQDLQRHGFVEAFQSPEVHQAIRQGMLGRIVVVYVEWSGAFDQQIIVPWAAPPKVLRNIQSPLSARHFLDLDRR
jgi:hypothetical protein